MWSSRCHVYLLVCIKTNKQECKPLVSLHILFSLKNYTLNLVFFLAFLLTHHYLHFSASFNHVNIDGPERVWKSPLFLSECSLLHVITKIFLSELPIKKDFIWCFSTLMCVYCVPVPNNVSMIFFLLLFSFRKYMCNYILCGAIISFRHILMICEPY